MRIINCNPPGYRSKQRAAYLLAAITFVGTLLGCSDHKKQAEELVRTATQHRDADRPIEALQLLHRAIALNPALAEALYLRGTCYGELSKPDDAIDDFSAATRLKPDWDEAWCALGITQLTKDQTEAGVISLTKALQLNARMRPALEARAQAYRDTNRAEEELHDLEELLKINPKNDEALLRHAVLLSQLDPVRAIEDLSSLISRDRENASAWMNRGLCYQRTGDTDRALADLNIACRLSPADFSPWFERGRILRIQQRSVDAISDLSKAVELAPREFPVRLELVRAYLDSSDIDAAEANLLLAEQISPDNHEFRFALALTEIARGHIDAAIERLQALLADEATVSQSLITLVRICLAEQLHKSGESVGAMSLIERVLTTDPENSSALQIRADLLATSNRRDEAIEDYTRLISANSATRPSVVSQCVLQRGRLHLEGHEWSAATADFSQYLAGHPNDVKTLSLRARSLLGQNDAKSAILDLTQALLKEPDSAELYQLRAAAFEQYNAPAAALLDMQKASSLQPENSELQIQVAERLFENRQFANAAVMLDSIAASNAGELSPKLRLLRSQARLAEGNIAGAYEDASLISPVESAATDSSMAADLTLLQATIALRRRDDAETLRLVPQVPQESLSQELLLLYGEALGRNNQTDESIRVFSTLLHANPSDSSTLLARGKIYLATEDWQAALHDATQVLRNTPNDPQALLIKGTSLFRNDSFREALETLDRPELQSRDTLDSRWMRILCCSHEKLTFREMEELNALLGVAPKHEEGRLLRAKLLEEVGHFDDAVTDLTAVLQQNPNNLSALKSRALLNQRSGHAAAAVDDFTRAIKLSPNDAELHYRCGIARYQIGQSDAARQDLDKAIELDSEHADAWYGIGNLEAARGQTEQAKAAFAKAVEIQPEHAAAWYNRGNLLFYQSQLKQAADCWTIAINLQPEMFRAYNNRAAAYDRMGRQAEAVVDYEKTLQLNPGFVRAWDNLAWLLATSENKRIRDPERAIQLAAKACELSEFKDWSCLNTLATCSAENQDFESALKWAKAARVIAPENEHSELDQLVSTYEARSRSKRHAAKPGASVR